MTPKPTVALGDLGHSTKFVANNFVPLNIALLASFAKKALGSEIEIHLFKSARRLLRFVEEERPDILALSNYMWNANLSLYVLRQYKQMCAKGFTVLGGPNFPKDEDKLSSWLTKHPFVDFIIDSEGEQPFLNIVQRALAEDFDLARSRASAISGCYSLDDARQLLHAPELPIDELDKIPSPYFEGLLDRFLLEEFDGFVLYPLFEGGRGCPYSCTFCRNSVGYKKMRFFSPDRFLGEIEYAARLLKKHNSSISTIMITDQNFGLYDRDYRIALNLRKIQDEYGFPRRVIVTTAKGNPDNVLRTVEACPTIALTLSVQSFDDEVLRIVKRRNFPLDKFKVYQATARRNAALTGSEIILGLPGDSREKHLRTIKILLENDIDVIIPFSFMLLPGTPAESSETRAAYSYSTKWRLIPAAFSELDGAKIFEIEEIVVATNSMSIEDYVYLRRIHLWVMSLFNGSVFRELRKLLLESGADFGEYLSVVDSFVKNSDCPGTITQVAEEFSSKCQSELFDSHELLYRHYEAEYTSLLEDRTGENLLQKYTFVLYSHIEDLAEVMIGAFLELSDESGIQDDWQAVFDTMRVRAKCIHRFLHDAPATRDDPISFVLDFDVPGWLASASGTLREFGHGHPVEYVAFYSDAVIDIWKNISGQYGKSREGKGRTLYRQGLQILNPTITVAEAE